MQTSRKDMISDGARGFYDLPLIGDEPYSWPPTQNVEQVTSSNIGTQDSSSGTGSYGINGSSSSACGSTNEREPSLDLNQSDLHDSYTSCLPVTESHLTDKVRELENAILGTYLDNFDDHVASPNQIPSEAEKWKYLLEVISRADLKEVLSNCAQAVASNDMVSVDWLMTELRQMVNVSGEPIQRLGAYMLEGLVARLASTGSSIYKALRCKEPAGSELLSTMHILYEICPYFKFGYMSANGAIAEAMKSESKIHIIDFQIAQGSQWITLIQALAAHPGGPPEIRITAIDDSTSACARGGGLDIVGQQLSKLAALYKIPFEFHALKVSASDVKLEDIEVRPGEAIAVNFALMLHHMPDESVGTQNHRDRLLRLAKSLDSKVVTLVEHESNSNTAPFYARFIEAMNYYLAVFESIDVTLPREHKERIQVEQHCLAREIVNIVACEGVERVERHELLGKWRLRCTMAGFTPYPLSSYVNATIKALLANYSTNYTLEERDGALFLGWKHKPLVASCAWM